MVDELEVKEPVPKSSGLDIKIIIIAAIFFVAALAGSYFMIKSVMAPLMPKEEKQAESKEKTAGVLIPLGEFTINITDVSGTRFLKTEVVLEVNDAALESEEEQAKFLPILRDQVITILSSKTAADLDVHNREGLKKEIKTKLNRSLEDKITNIYFNTFIMQ